MKKPFIYTKGKYYRDPNGDGTFDPSKVKNPEAVEVWMKAYKRLYEFCQKHNVTEWGGTEITKAHKVLTPDEMEKEINDHLKNGKDFYEIISVGLDDMGDMNHELTKYSVNSITLKIWVGTLANNNKKLTYPVVVTMFEMPSFRYELAWQFLTDDDPDDVGYPLGLLSPEYHYFVDRDWDYDEYCKIIDKFEEEIVRAKTMETDLLDMKATVRSGTALSLLLEPFKKKYKI